MQDSDTVSMRELPVLVESALCECGWLEVGLLFHHQVFELRFEARQRLYRGEGFDTKWRYSGELLWREDYPRWGASTGMMEVVWFRSEEGVARCGPVA